LQRTEKTNQLRPVARVRASRGLFSHWPIAVCHVRVRACVSMYEKPSQPSQTSKNEDFFLLLQRLSGARVFEQPSRNPRKPSQGSTRVSELPAGTRRLEYAAGVSTHYRYRRLEVTVSGANSVSCGASRRDDLFRQPGSAGVNQCQPCQPNFLDVGATERGGSESPADG
jgi:hypothetical protein